MENNEEIVNTEIIPEEEQESKLELYMRTSKENYNKFLYAKAETDNVRKRMQSEIDRVKKTAGKDIIIDLLPVLDTIENAYSMTNDTTGLELIYKSIKNTLEKYNVESYGTVGDKFDSDLFEAISMSDDEEYESGMITKIYQCGYKMNGEVIRYGKVIVKN